MYTAALIGCGKISLKHIEGFVNNASTLKLLSICDPIIERAAEKEKEYKKKIADADITIYTDYKKMLAEQKPDIVSITTDPGKHKAIALDCFNAGSHVVCEKPMALSIVAADAMIASAKNNKRKLAVCFQSRFDPTMQKLRTAIESGRFGRLLHGMIQIRWNRSDAYYAEASWRGTWEHDGGTLLNQCTHGIDMLQWMMGEDAVRVQAQTRRFMRPIEAEDFGAAIVEFASGAVGLIEGSATVFPNNLNETLSIFGERGSAVIGGLAMNKIETWRFADSPDNTEQDSPSAHLVGHTALFKDFVDAIETDREPLISGESGKKALEIILAIYKSQITGKAVDLPCNFSTTEMKGYFDQ